MHRPSVLPTTLLLCALAAGPRAALAVTIPADRLAETPLATPPPGPEATYLTTLHEHVHRRWTDNFLRLIGERLEASSPLNVPDRNVTVDLIIAPDGQLTSATIARPSGFPGFDDAAIEVLRDAVPFPKPPLAVQSDDGSAHLQWLFARDQRRCSGLRVIRTYDPIDVAMPKLLQAGRRDEALNRIGIARGNGVHVAPQFTQLAAESIKAALRQPWMTAPIARALAIYTHGDPSAVTWLETAVRRADQAAEAGRALVELKVPVCPLVKDLLEGQDPAQAQTAAVALATAGEAACVPGLSKLLASKARPEARAAAAIALGSVEGDSAKASLSAAAKDENPQVHGAAMLAQIRPGAGRRTVITVELLLRDPSADLRAASAAGVVRAGGDTNLADLYVLFKESDARPSLAALHELERLHTEESTKLIARLAHRPQLEVEKLAADVLLRRGAKDSYTALKGYLDPSADPAIRGRALVIADEATLKGLEADPKLGVWVYRARLLLGEKDLAADWFVAYGSKMPPAAQADAMASWLMREPPLPAPPPPPAGTPAPAPATHF